MHHYYTTYANISSPRRISNRLAFFRQASYQGKQEVLNTGLILGEAMFSALNWVVVRPQGYPSGEQTDATTCFD
jgi:hypothetical protein